MRRPVLAAALVLGSWVTAQAASARADTRSDVPASLTTIAAGTPVTTDAEPELVALERAERALFPRALRGVRAQFSFDLEDHWGRAAGGAASSASSSYRGLELPEIFPNLDGRIITYLDFFRVQPEGKALLRAWAKKRGRYEELIASGLAQSGLPRDLVWQSLVESAHNPSIRSPVGAAGLWQFMPETARQYGLVVDRWLDERLDPERSTEAAAKMMGELYQRFGNWELALAAYNMGEAGLLRAIRKYNTNDFWTLARYEAGLPWETALYVPRIVALTIAMKNPALFGVSDIVLDEPVAVETVVLAPGQPLSSVARAVEMPVDQLKRLNPHLLLGRLPPAVGTTRGAVRVFVPRGKGELLRNRLSRVQGPEPDLESYALRRGETVDSLASARGVTPELIRSINQIGVAESLDAGAVLLLPRGIGEPAGATEAADSRVAIVPPDVVVGPSQRRIFCQVSPGDDLSRIADALKITRAELLEANALDPSAKLQANMLLSVLLPKDANPRGVRCFEEAAVRVLVAGSESFLSYFEGLSGKERVVVQAKPRDTLAAIGARHGVSVGMMERINRRSRRTPLQAGEPVVVYIRRAAEPERVGSTR